MQSIQHSSPPCRVYIHPTACTSPAHVEAIQRRTGQLVIISAPGRIALANLPATTTTPFGGDAA